MKRIFSSLLAMTIFATPMATFAFDPNYIISDSELTDPFALDRNQIQHFLDRGYLGDYTTEDHEGVERSAADIIVRTSQNVGVNPKFLLVLLQKEQSLIEDDDPNDRQLDWATGYAVCDSCSKDDPAIQRWKGFGKQVNSAALQFTEGYLADIEESGTTQGKYGPGVAVEIDNKTIVPQNAATAAMYAYTPHIHGNQNFVTIWNRWFSVQHPSGTLLKAVGDPDVYLIEYGYKRPIKSWSAFVSRFNPNLIIEVPQSQLDLYAEGRAINFPNFSLLRDEDARIYLLVNDGLREIDSMETFYAIGFKEDEIVDILNTDLAGFDQLDSITSASVYPQGNLLELETNGAMYYIENGKRHQIFDDAVLRAHFPNRVPEKALPVAVEQYSEGAPLLFPDGYIVKGESPDVFVISEGKKRPIESESVFLSYGWSWEDIVVTTDKILSKHETGLPIQASIE